jgi:hypothetical protein
MNKYIVIAGSLRSKFMGCTAHKRLGVTARINVRQGVSGIARKREFRQENNLSALAGCGRNTLSQYLFMPQWIAVPTSLNQAHRCRSS